MPREIEILHLLANGATNREIALKLVVSEGTVKNHISNIL
ncbi:MAG: response regulator transcription factor [Chloroflexi bacterium AL-W]|nr:response regulator transcription factor [Chloroflexi bacterium AL-N10]NOK73966.1 response regulator transcription factor [Chloroflexi bacterium AL-N5]NOK82934.1 response regulator transcription factor [Chloroflexi bacterium AL-W]NOK90456.1 response regulator transcription factor [Chloroflexi bacterium AL-N15]